MKKLILFFAVMLISTQALAVMDSLEGKVEKVDSTTIRIINNTGETFEISELKAKRDYFVKEKAQVIASLDERIRILDARIQEAALLGVE